MTVPARCRASMACWSALSAPPETSLPDEPLVLAPLSLGVAPASGNVCCFLGQPLRATALIRTRINCNARIPNLLPGCPVQTCLNLDSTGRHCPQKLREILPQGGCCHHARD